MMFGQGAPIEKTARHLTLIALGGASLGQGAGNDGQCLPDLFQGNTRISLRKAVRQKRLVLDLDSGVRFFIDADDDPLLA
ncbi:MAG TPA: hypothetical protein VNH11_24885 [Pirellulales bacterium]|nr:hypothetical protein [Pirellulales bacterium]